jgi:hypothetical protein
MPRKKSYSGAVRGEATHDKYSVAVRLDSGEALSLIRHIAGALTYGRRVVIEPHWGRRGGTTKLHRTYIRSI